MIAFLIIMLFFLYYMVVWKITPIGEPAWGFAIFIAALMFIPAALATIWLDKTLIECWLIGIIAFTLGFGISTVGDPKPGSICRY